MSPRGTRPAKGSVALPDVGPHSLSVDTHPPSVLHPDFFTPLESSVTSGGPGDDPCTLTSLGRVRMSASVACCAAVATRETWELWCVLRASPSEGAPATWQDLAPACCPMSGSSGSRTQVILCFSPVGSVLRVRARKFPAVVNCTAIDWFHEWPQDALVSVSARFLEETEGIQVSLWAPLPPAPAVPAGRSLETGLELGLGQGK